MDFADTLRIVDEVGYASAFSFKYSPRPGTPAATMEQVAEPVKAERLGRLAGRDQCEPGAVQRVAGGPGGRGPVRADRPPSGQIVGRSPWLSPVHIDGSAGLIGSIERVTITGAGPNSLFGALSGHLAGPQPVMAEMVA